MPQGRLYNLPPVLDLLKFLKLHAPDGTANVAPEYEDCRALAVARGVPLKVVHRAALAAALRMPGAT